MRVAAAAIVLLLAGCSSGPPPASTAEDYVDEYGGSIAAIEAILGYTDCSLLVETFDAAQANMDAFGGPGSARGKEQLGRMSAAADRAESLGCEDF